jgi:hypothetical protein
MKSEGFPIPGHDLSIRAGDCVNLGWSRWELSHEKPTGQVIQIDEARIRDHLGEMVRGTVEERR